MKTRALDESHDWTFGRSQSNYKSFSDAIKQNVLTAVLEVRGDWFLALDSGVDWVNYLGRSSNLVLLESDIKSSVLNVNGVYRITQMDIDLNREKRKATISIEYIDIYNVKNLVNVNVNNQ